MAVSIQASNMLGSRIEGIPRNSSARGGADNLLRSQFLGSGRIPVASRTRTTEAVVHNAANAGAIRSASFFEKFGRLFSPADKEQVLAVFEINDLDRGSPVTLKGPLNPKNPGLGTLVPYTNKVFDASGKRYLGISAGLCTCIEQPNTVTIHYETMYTHYLGEFGQLSAMGPYITTSDTKMAVTGGTGIFKGAQGFVELHNVTGPLKIKYTYYLTGIDTLPEELTSPKAEAHAAAVPVKARA